VVYFEAPYASQARAVVIAPQTDGPSASFFAAALAGLTTSPVLQPATLSSLFTLWDGASSLPVTHLVATAGKGGDVAAGVVSSARKTLGVLGSVVPSAHAFVSRAAQAVLLGEAIGLSTKVRDDYEGAPVRSLQTVSRAVSLSANQTVTLTSRSGQIPVTVASQFPGPVNVVLQVSSSELTFPAGNRFPLRLTTRVHLEPVQVSTLTSGLTTMNVALLAPGSSGWVLGTKRLSIRSTAISAEAIGLSVGALLVLAAWWARSYARHRRREAAQRATRLGADPPPVA
ncbi:MAG: hypothetical protein JWM85_2341, partial [Acidimicrobiaceae bacterium]|nr:hypothetical protein [Acidimicrobiaceae bacterium]